MWLRNVEDHRFGISGQKIAAEQLGGTYRMAQVSLLSQLSFVFHSIALSRQRSPKMYFFNIQRISIFATCGGTT